MIFLPAFFGRRLEPGLSRKPVQGPTEGLQGPTEGLQRAYRGPTEGLQKMELERGKIGRKTKKIHPFIKQPPLEGRRSPVRPGTVQGRHHGRQHGRHHHGRHHGRPHHGRRHHGRHHHGRGSPAAPTLRRSQNHPTKQKQVITNCQFLHRVTVT